MRVGIIREGKIPPDSRVAITPDQCRELMQKYPEIEIVVQPSPKRCYTDEEYEKAFVKLEEDLSDCDVLFGVKEVPVALLIPGKTYFFFSHTIKEQPYNRKLLQEVLKKNIRLIDYEVITDEKGNRLIAFGRFAGIVGAHNGLMAYGIRTGLFDLKPMHTFKDLNAVKEFYDTINLPPFKVVLTGGGRVARGAMETLDYLKIRKISSAEFLNEEFDHPVYVQLNTEDLYERKGDQHFNAFDFHENPENYVINFKEYTAVADIMINGIFWDPKAPVFFTKEEMKDADFKIQTIADVTCDINGSVPSTVRASTILDPVYGYDPQSEQETTPYQKRSIDVMAVDNLPNELPRDASEAFGKMIMKYVWDELTEDSSDLLDRASITRDGKLTDEFKYLQDYVDGNK